MKNLIVQFITVFIFLSVVTSCKKDDESADVITDPPSSTLDSKSLWAWGDNHWGVLGLDPQAAFACAKPNKIGIDSTWSEIDCSPTNLALKEDGTLWAWGRNYSYTPTQIGTDNDWAKIACGGLHYMAIKKDGSLWIWGEYGSVQAGTSPFNYVPTKVDNNYDWDKVSCDDYSTIALKKDGTLWRWGYVDNQLYLDNPVQNGTDTDWNYIASGVYTHYAIKKNGTLWAWGSNDNSEYGNNTTTGSILPVQVGSDNNWKMISKGSNHTLAIKTDGTLWAWGWNDFGQLGIGYTSSIRQGTPIQVGYDTDWDNVSAGMLFSVALKEDGTIWTWGQNYNGVLGIGEFNSGYSEIYDCSSPVKIDSGYYKIDASLHCLAIKK